MTRQLPVSALETPLARAIGRALADVNEGRCGLVEIQTGATRVRVIYREGRTPSVEFL